MTVRIENVQIGFSDRLGDGDRYFIDGQGSRLLRMYGELLEMQPINIGYWKLTNGNGRIPDIGFEWSPDDEPPRWLDPEHPQQIHLDIEVDDLAGAEELVVAHGATKLREAESHRVLADEFGHPFCLYPRLRPSGSQAVGGRIVRVVIDCAHPHSLADFYAELLDMRHRVLDTADRVVIEGDSHEVGLAFQWSRSAPPTWPDPRQPQQLHLDLSSDDPSILELVEKLGGSRLSNPARPDASVIADPDGHPHCLGPPET